MRKRHRLLRSVVVALVTAVAVTTVAPPSATGAPKGADTSRALSAAGVALDGPAQVTGDASVILDPASPSATAVVDGKRVRVSLDGATPTGSVQRGNARIYDGALRNLSAATHNVAGGFSS